MKSVKTFRFWVEWNGTYNSISGFFSLEEGVNWKHASLNKRLFNLNEAFRIISQVFHKIRVAEEANRCIAYNVCSNSTQGSNVRAFMRHSKEDRAFDAFLQMWVMSPSVVR